MQPLVLLPPERLKTEHERSLMPIGFAYIESPAYKKDSGKFKRHANSNIRTLGGFRFQFTNISTDLDYCLDNVLYVLFACHQDVLT